MTCMVLEVLEVTVRNLGFDSKCDGKSLEVLK